MYVIDWKGRKKGKSVACCDLAKGENTSKFAMYIETKEMNIFNNKKDTKYHFNPGDVSGSLLLSDLVGGLDGNDSFSLSLYC